MARTIDKSDAGLTRLFASLDIEGNGYLSEAQMRQALFEAGCGPLRGELINEMMDAADANGDGVIDLDEFKAIFVAMDIMLGNPVDGLTPQQAEAIRSDSPGSRRPPSPSGRRPASAAPNVSPSPEAVERPPLNRALTRPIGGSAPPLPPVPPPSPGQKKKLCNTCGHKWCAASRLQHHQPSHSGPPRTLARLPLPLASHSRPPPTPALARTLPRALTWPSALACLQGGQVQQARVPQVPLPPQGRGAPARAQLERPPRHS